MLKAGTTINRAFAIILCATLLVGTISGCGSNSQVPAAENVSPAVENEQAAEIIAEQILEELSADDVASHTVEPETEEAVIQTVISDDWHDYVGNIDTFVYGLIVNEYQLAYKTFRAEITLPDDTQIYGIGYTDYSDYYEREDGKGGYFPAGFLALIGEAEIPKEAIEDGLEIFNLDNADSDYQYVYAYNTEPYLEHCVIWDQYLRYGIDEKGVITYQVQKYERGNCDESLGALYSYDEDRYVYDPDVGNYKFIAGKSLYEAIDYAEIENQINLILQEQDKHFAEVDVDTVIYEAQEAMNAYLLSLQEETFMGYSVAELLKISETLDPKDCLRFTPDGLIQVDMTEAPPREPEAFTKWITGICCGTAIVACFAATIFVPALAPATAAISGAAVEVFMQVVAQNHVIEDVNWGKVAIAAATGAMLAWACPLIASNATTGIVNALGQRLTAETATQLGKLAGYGILTFSNAVVSGASSAAFKVIDGGSAEEAMNAFLVGAAIGAACTVLASAVTKVVSKVGSIGINAIKNKFPNSWLVKTASSKAASASAFIGKHRVKLFDGKLDHILIPKSINEAAEAAGYQLKLQQAGSEQLVMRIDQLPSDTNKNFIKTDADGNELTKEALRRNGGTGEIRLRDDCDPAIKKVFDDHGVTKLEIKDGFPDFGPISEYKAKVHITPNRDVNFDQTYKTLLEEWADDPSLIPPEFQNRLDELGKSIYDITDSQVESILSDLQWTIHEGLDDTIYLVQRAVHSRLSHGGGVALATAYEAIEVATVFFKELHDAAATGVVGTLIIEGAQ